MKRLLHFLILCAISMAVFIACKPDEPEFKSVQDSGFFDSAFLSTAETYKSVASGDWSDTAIWRLKTDTGWITTSHTPSILDTVFLERNTNVFLSQDVECADLWINLECDTSVDSARLDLDTYFCDFYGKIRWYEGNADNPIGEPNTVTNPWAYSIIDNGGKLRVKGSIPRDITIWSSTSSENFTTGNKKCGGFDIIIETDSGVTMTMLGNFKFGSILYNHADIVHRRDSRYYPASEDNVNSQETVEITNGSKVTMPFYYRIKNYAYKEFFLDSTSILIAQHPFNQITAKTVKIEGLVEYKPYCSGCDVTLIEPHKFGIGEQLISDYKGGLKLTLNEDLLIPNDITIYKTLTINGDVRVDDQTHTISYSDCDITYTTNTTATDELYVGVSGVQDVILEDGVTLDMDGKNIDIGGSLVLGSGSSVINGSIY